MAEWIDVGTVAAPKLLTEESIGSLIDCMDTGGRKLRWVVHLDRDDVLAQHFDDNLAMIERVAGRFDDALIMAADTPQGFGRSFRKVLAASHNDLLNVEDKWRWVRKFCLDDAYKHAGDGYGFARIGMRIGSMSPSLWKRHVVSTLLANWPSSATEVDFKRVLHLDAGLRLNATSSIPDRLYVPVGLDSKGNDSEDNPELQPPPKSKCILLGAKLADRQISNEMTVEVFKCHHATIDETTDRGCGLCPHMKEGRMRSDARKIGGTGPGAPYTPSKAKFDSEFAGLTKDVSMGPSRADEWALEGARKVENKPIIVDRFGMPAGLENMYLNGTLFLILGGPSLKTNDLSKLQGRGIVTMAVNNSACVVKPNIWTYGDKSNKFHLSIWRDPSIMKICPYPKLTNHLREKLPDGTFRDLRDTVGEQPNVFGIQRNLVFEPDTWLHENTVNWGNGSAGVEKNGRPKVLTTFLQALRLAYLFGFRTVNLVGCDFMMTPGSPYAFEQFKSQGGVRSNNWAYEKQAVMLDMLKPHFDKARFRVFNCNLNSGLSVFPKITYDEAIATATSSLPDWNDTFGWYDKLEETEPKE